jgi:hypothetical protein
LGYQGRASICKEGCHELVKVNMATDAFQYNHYMQEAWHLEMMHIPQDYSFTQQLHLGPQSQPSSSPVSPWQQQSKLPGCYKRKTRKTHDIHGPAFCGLYTSAIRSTFSGLVLHVVPV